MSKILGIDPGLQKTGWGIVSIEHGHLNGLAAGVIETDTKTPLPNRLLKIFKVLNEIIATYGIDNAAIEDTYVNANFKSSLKLSHARAAAILSVATAGINLQEYPAKTIKKTIVGTGQADKGQMIHMVNYFLPNIPIKDKDAADAMAIAICHASYCKLG